MVPTRSTSSSSERAKESERCMVTISSKSAISYPLRSCAVLDELERSRRSVSSEPHGYIVWLGAGNKETEGITKNLWTVQTGLGNGPWGNNTNWGMPISLRDHRQPAFASSETVCRSITGVCPRTWTTSASTLWTARCIRRPKLWNMAYHWSLGDLQSEEIDQQGSRLKMQSRSATSGAAVRQRHLVATQASAGSMMRLVRAASLLRMRAT